ncbi:MAG: Rrf2 family transcriptional regulator [Clostridiales Family XIII bacterium]|nr:Rrf2 family transcriptional regulator [Clostridiales Family XIII bacterium]
MVVKRETDYSLRVLRALLSGEQKTAGEICAEEVMPLPFVYRILKKMEVGGLVKITRGKDGGASLDCDLKAVSLYDLLTTLGDRPYVNDCMKPGYQCERRRETGKICIAHRHLAEVQAALENVLKERSLYYMLTED